MAINRTYLKDSDWNSVIQIKAPLKWATKAVDYLLKTMYNKQSSFYSKLVRPSLTKFNTTFFSFDYLFQGNMKAIPLEEVGSSAVGNYRWRYLRRLYGIAGSEGEGYGGSLAVVATGDATDIVALVSFKTVGEIKTEENFTHVTEPVILSGYSGEIITSDKNWGNYSCILSNEITAPKTLATEYGNEFDNWVVPYVSWYYRPVGGSYPRTKKSESSDLCFFPFVPLYGDGLNFFNPTKGSSTFPRGDNTTLFPLYLYIKPAYSPEFSKSKSVLTEASKDPVSCKVYEYLPPPTTPAIQNVNEYTNPPVPYKTLALITENGFTTWSNSTRTALKNVSTLDNKYFNDRPVTSSWTFYNIYAFKSKQDFISYFNDWGIPCTESLEEALNTPLSPVDPTIPVDPPVTEIPSYPDDTTDNITIIPPDYTASSFGQCKIYTPTSTTALIEWLGTNTFWQDINRLFANPIDAVFGLRMYNFDIVQHDTSHTVANSATKILNVSTEIPNHGILNGYNTIVNGGSYRHTAYYGNFADYLNTSYDIYIPYVGIRRLNPSDVVNRTLQLQYAVDFSTGDTTVFLLSDNKLVMATSCNISAEIPLQTSNINDVNFKSIMGVLTGAVSGAKTGFLTGSIGGAVGGAAIGGITSGLDNYLNSIEYGYQGGISGNNSYALLEPFLIIRRFPIANVGDYQGLYGLANSSTVIFSSLTTGYIKADTVEINTRATDRERDEIIALLKSGVHLK